MKKTLALLLAVLMAFSVCGCAESLQNIEIPPLPNVTPTPPPADAAVQTPDPTAQAAPVQPDGQLIIASDPIRSERKPSILISNNRTELTNQDPEEGATLILSFSYDMPRVIEEADPMPAAKINETLATLEETFYTGNDYGLQQSFLGYNTMLEAAEDNYTYVKENQVEGMALEFTDDLSARTIRADDNVISLRYSESLYTGGAHGSYFEFAYNFDAVSGELLTLDQLSSDREAFADFLVQSMLDLAEKDPDGYYSDRVVDSFLPEGGREEAFRNLLREGSWYFNREGLVLFSSLYELGPYAAGITEFTIPYASLEGRILDRFLFPGDRDGKGRLSVEELSELEGGELEIVDKVTVNTGGQMLCLVAEGTVYDVSISPVYYVDRFYENGQFWFASVLSDCALQLEVVVPEGLPNLLISYYTADGMRHGKLLSQSGQDGSYMLVDDDIQAVG